MDAEVGARVQAGRAARAAAPRGGFGPWEPQHRRQDALRTVLAQSEQRLPELAPIRHARMAASPWHYYRGAAAVMAADLATGASTGLEVQLCGDAHVLNFGLWATPERNLAFDLRDFDETLPGPFEWDVMRLVTSLVVAARIDARPWIGDKAVQAAVASYREHMAEYAQMPELGTWYDVTHVDRLLRVFTEPEAREAVSAHIDRKSTRRTSRGALDKLTESTADGPRITENGPFRVHLDELERAHAVTAFERYRDSLLDDRRHLLDRFRLVDVVRQVVGVGSVGMRVYLALLEGRGGDDPLFLQLKQATASVYEPFVAPSAYPSPGQRVVTGKRLIQSATDIFVGWSSVDDVHYYVRQFRDMKVVPDAERIVPILVDFASACGAVLARAHARTGDAVAIASYLGKGDAFARAMGEYAVSYADQNERDHAELAGAVMAGQVSAGRAW